MSLSPTILLTRPKLDSERFIASLPAGLEIITSPVFTITPISVTIDFNKYDSLIFTSQNAIKLLADDFDLTDMKAFAVGEKTAGLARNFGMNVVVADGNADSLVSRIIGVNPKGNLLHVRGTHTRGEVVERLINAGIDTDYIVNYAQTALGLNKKALTVLQVNGTVIVPIFSPRSAVLLSAALNKIPLTAKIVVLGLSEAVVQAWCGPMPEKFVVAKNSTSEAMAKEIRQLIR